MDRPLRAFLAVAEEGNLTAAAARLGLAQPSLSKLIGRLETQYGAPLFRRLPRGMALTQCGESLYRRAKTIEMELRFAGEEISALKHGHKSVLRVGAGPLYHLEYVPAAFDAILNRFPATRLELVTEATTETVPMLLRGELDLALGSIDESFDVPGVESVFLTRVQSAIVVRPDHRLAGRPDFGVDELAEAESRWVLYQRDTAGYEHLQQAFRRAGLAAPAVAVQTSSFATGLEIVRRGNYFLSAPLQLSATVARSGLTMVSARQPYWEFPSGLWVRRSSLQFPVIRHFIQTLKALCPPKSEPSAHPEARSGSRGPVSLKSDLR